MTNTREKPVLPGNISTRVMEDYNIQSKATHVVTDNGANFVKAFKEYSVSGQVVFKNSAF